MKKIIFCFFSLMMTNLFADSFSDIIQDLTVQIACTGQYNATMAGETWKDDPIDFYNPRLMASRFTELAGKKTEYPTFYGICYNYAKYAFLDIQKYHSIYEQSGMRKNQFYITGVDDYPYELFLVTLSDAEKSDLYRNGEYLKKHKTEYIGSHKTSDNNRVTQHAWIWIQRNDGTWFWIDPTFTDNLGYVVYGYVDRNTNEEIQLKPDKNYCIVYPSYLDKLPAYEGIPYNDELYIDNAPTYDYQPTVVTEDEFMIGAAYIKSIDSEKNFTHQNFVDGFEIIFASPINISITNHFEMLYFAYMSCEIDEQDYSSWVVGSDYGYALAGFFVPYVGLGLGTQTIDNETNFEYKIDLGLILNFNYFQIGAELSFGTILGTTYSVLLLFRGP